MTELEIRLALVDHLSRTHSDPMKIVEEMCVCDGRSRVDVALIDEGKLHGFEIKSKKDNLSRLPTQLGDYLAVFDRLTVVIGVKHLTGVLHEIPEWCGVLVATPVSGQVELDSFRAGRLNLHKDRYWVAQQLWREEALEVLHRYGLERGVKSKSRPFLWQRLADRLPLEQLTQEVCRALLARPSRWRPDARTRLVRIRPGPR